MEEQEMDTTGDQEAALLETCDDDEDEGDMTLEQTPESKPSKSHLFKQPRPGEDEPDVAITTLSDSVPTLTCVEYPGRVVNYDNAVISLGGTGKLSHTLANQSDRLEVKLRPGDPYSNPIYAESSTVGGYLFRIRRKKKKIPDTETSFKCTIKWNEIQHAIHVSPIETETEIPYLIRGLCAPLQSEGVRRNEERIKIALAKQDRIIAEGIRKTIPLTSHNPKKKFLKPLRGDPNIRKLQERELSTLSDFEVEVLGRVDTAYTFRRGQLCDFQYLPTRFAKGKQISMLNKILPVFNEPEKNLQFISENIDAEPELAKTQTPLFLVPSFFSRIDKPVMTTSNLTEEGQRLLAYSEHQLNFDELIDTEGFLNPITASKGKDSDFVVVPMRSKRIIFSHFCNFRSTDPEWFADPKGDHVPKQVMAGATQDIEKKGLDTGGILESLRALFENRPIWSRQALEVETNRPHGTLKYLLPAVSYFAVNGPWRTFWIRLGYDPRNFKESFEYQLLDYRIPFVYRNYSHYCARSDERNCRYNPTMIPPKMQMFYQLCDVHVPQIEEVRVGMRARLRLEDAGAGTTDMVYTSKFGFLDEETLEYCRYCISRCVEEVLKEQGKISTLTLPPIDLLPGGQIPKDVIRTNINNRKSLIPHRRHRRTGGKARASDNLMMARGRARRNSGSSSVVDLEIDRDEFSGKAASEEISEDEVVEFDDYDEDSEVDLTAAEWGVMDPDEDED